MERILLLLTLLALLGAAALLVVPSDKPEEARGKVLLLDEELRVLGEADAPPSTLDGRVLVGKTERGYVYVPPEGLFVPKFVDRLLYLIGREAPADIPVEWWMEHRGERIEPVGGRAYSGFDLVVKTPFEVLRTRLPVVPLYTQYHMGAVFEANGDCIVVKRDGERVVPVLLNGKSILDPDAEVVCRPCKEVFIEVNGRGYFSIGDGLRYYFFGEFDGGFWACRSDWVKVYVSGYKPWSGRVEGNTEVRLVPLEEWEELEGDGVFIDSTGALASVGPARVPPGAYTEYSVFPFLRRGYGIEVIDLNETVWLGYKERKTVPLYSFVRKGEAYYYVLREGLIPVDGFVCKDVVCTPIGGGTALFAFGNCELFWDGELSADCPPLGITVKSPEG